MSAGIFETAVYTSNDGLNFPCRVQPETLAMSIDGSNNDNSATADEGLPSANMRGGRTENGVTARKIRLKLADGATPPAGYSGQPIYVPVLTPGNWSAAVKGAAVTYLGVAWTVASRVPEFLN